MVEDQESIFLRKDWIAGQNELDPEDKFQQGDIEGLPGGVQGVRALPKPLSTVGILG